MTSLMARSAGLLEDRQTEDASTADLTNAAGKGGAFLRGGNRLWSKLSSLHRPFIRWEDGGMRSATLHRER